MVVVVVVVVGYQQGGQGGYQHHSLHLLNETREGLLPLGGIGWSGGCSMHDGGRSGHGLGGGCRRREQGERSNAASCLAD